MALVHRLPRRGLLHLLLALVALLGAVPAHAANVAAEVQTSWRLLDYIAVDYREAIAGGRVINAAEYQEMAEFSASVTKRLEGLPQGEARTQLLGQAKALQAAIAAKVEPPLIAASARKIAAGLLAAYPVPLAPARTPDAGRGAALYAQNCASCHGAKGEGASG